MPAESKAQQRFMGAELARKRAGEATDTGMSEQQLKDFAATKQKGLPEHKKEEKKHEGRGYGAKMQHSHGRKPNSRGGY